MDARRLLRRGFFVVAFGAAGCDGKTGLEDERDSLVAERSNLLAHQTNLQIAALNILKGRGFQDVSPEESAQLATLFQQRAAADAQLRAVDSRLEEVQNQIQGSYQSTTP